MSQDKQDYYVHVTMQAPTDGTFKVKASSKEEAIKEYETNILPKIPTACKDITIVRVYTQDEMDTLENMDPERTIN